MRIETMQNVSTAKSSKASEALGIFEPPISCLQDKRTNQYATEPCNRELSSTSLPDSYGQKTKRANEDKVYAECIDSKIIKDKRGSGRIRTTDLLFTRQAHYHYATEPCNRGNIK